MKLMLTAIPAITLVLAGCMANHAATEDVPQCNEARARSYIGADATGRNLTEARIASRANFVRTVGQGEAVSLEFMPGRLTIEIDNSNVISDVICR